MAARMYFKSIMWLVLLSERLLSGTAKCEAS